MNAILDELSANITLPVLGKISAGQPTFSETNLMGEVTWKTGIPQKRSSEYFALRVTGDSMIEDGIFDGNYLVVKNGTDFSNGDIVIAYVNEEPTVKRIYRRGNQVVLQPANSAYDPIEISLQYTPFRVGGMVIDVIRN
jgi:repressor LexA